MSFFDPDNLDSILKECLYFTGYSVKIIDGKFHLKEIDGYVKDFDSYYELIYCLIGEVYSSFWDYIRRGVSNE